MDDKKVSIVLPVYNGEQYLSSALESILCQSYRNIELILVNDCSTDSTEEIIARYQARDSRIVSLRNEKNLKLPASLNRGFAHATGEYYSWTSDDNLYKPNAIEEMVRCLEARPELGMVYCDYEIIDENGAVTRQFQVGDSESQIFHNTLGACFLYRRQVAEAVGEYDTSRYLVEDYDYWLRIRLACQIEPIHQCLYQYRLHSNSLTSTKKQAIELALIQMHRDYLKRYEKEGMKRELLFRYFHYNLHLTYSSKRRLLWKFVFSLRHPSYPFYLLKHGAVYD